MKKLIYNENTKEIDVIDQDDLSEKEKMKKGKTWLENNKIFFEIFSFVFVGIMGIVISFVGWKTNERSAGIYQRKLEILDNDREPYFEIKSEEIYKELFETKYNNTIAIRCYTISNLGGYIRDVSIAKECCAIIHVQKYESGYGGYDIFKYTFYNLFFNNPDSSRRQFFDDGEDIVFYEYGIEKEDKIDYKDIFPMIEEELNNSFLRNVKVHRKNFLEITYINYKNEKCTKKFEFTNESMWLSNEDEEGFSLLNNTETEIEKIPGEVKRRLKNWMRQNKNKNY